MLRVLSLRFEGLELRVKGLGSQSDSAVVEDLRISGFGVQVHGLVFGVLWLPPTSLMGLVHSSIRDHCLEVRALWLPLASI